MQHLLHRRKPAGFSIVELLVIIGILAVLSGLIVTGGYWLRCQAAEADVMNRAQNLGYALHLYHMEHRKYPSAYPSDLDARLAPYLERELSDCLDTEEAFVTPACPSEGAEPLNRSYVPPSRRTDKSGFVLAFEPRLAGARTAVLFGDNIARLVETLPVQYAGSELKPGSVVQGGVVTFSTGTSIELAPNTMMRMIRSIRTQDGSVFHIVKVPRYKPGFLRADVVGADLVQVATGAGVVCIRNGVADLDVVPVVLPEAPAATAEEDIGDDPVR